MKKLLLLVLAAPLAGCAQRAEMASSVGQPAQGPFTLRYKLADQNSNQYRLRIDGDTTTGISSTASPGSTPSPSSTPGSTPSETTPAPSRTVRAKFQTQMTIDQVASRATEPLSGSGTGASGSASGTESGTTSMNEDRTAGNERAGDTTMPSDTASEGGMGGTASAATPERFELRQQVTNWTAQVDLPEGQIPNRFNGTFQNGELNIQAQGAQIELPQRYQEQIRQVLSRPVIATVTSTGEILNVEWPVPEQTSSMAPGVQTESSADGLRAMTGSTETLNLWFGVIRLPDQAVNVGQTWDAKDRFPVRAGTTGPQFHMEREAKYTLTNVNQTPDGPVAEIAVNETLKLVRGEMTAGETPAASSGTDSTTDSTTAPGGAAGTKPDLLQTRMGKVYFNIDRGLIDRAEQQVSVTWDTAAGTIASRSTTGSTTNVMTQGQLQGTVHLERIGNPVASTGSTGNVANAPGNSAPLNAPGTAPANTPTSMSPSGALGPPEPYGSARTATP